MDAYATNAALPLSTPTLLTETPNPAFTAQTLTETPTVTATSSGTISPTATLTDGGALVSTPLPGGGLSDNGQAVAAAAPGSPTAAYLVFTETPVLSALAPAWTLTPLPTLTPTPSGFSLMTFMAPTGQNLSMLLLCFTFFAASGLGILGLITSVIYMRSQHEDENEDRSQLW
jgi:hypothetical protein